MKSAMRRAAALLALIVIGTLFASCTTGSATRTSSTIYQPTDSSKVEILFEKPARAYTVIGTVGSRGNNFASDDSMFRAMQKEAAEIGANAILIQGKGIDHVGDSWSGSDFQSSRALAIRWNDMDGPQPSYSLTPTSVTPTTPAATQVIPKGAGQP